MVEDGENIGKHFSENFDKEQWERDFYNLIMNNYEVVVYDKLKINPLNIDKSTETTKRKDGSELPNIIEVNGEVKITFKLKKE